MRFEHIIPSCLVCSCFILPPKSLAFDYQSYSNTRHHIRILTPANNITPSIASNTQNKKESLVKNLSTKLFEALDSDLVPVKIFDTNQNFSIYFKPAKITKLGIKIKF